MSRYTTVESIIWHDEKFRSLPEDARMLFLYLLTSPHSNMLGIFYLPKLYACSDLQWDPERYQRGIDTLCHTLLIEVDKDIVWVKNYLKYNQIRGPRQVTGAVNRLMSLPDTKLIGPFMKNLEKHLLEDDLKLFKELYTKPYEYPSDTLSDTLCDTPSIAGTDTVTDTDTESASDRACAREEKDDDEERETVREITDAFTETFTYPPNSTQMQMLTSFLDDGLSAWHIREALKRAAQAGARSPTYVRTILQDWVNKQAFTPDDVKRLDETFKPKKARAGPRVFGDDYEYKPRDRPPKEVFPWLYDDEPVEGDEPGSIKKEA